MQNFVQVIQDAIASDPRSMYRLADHCKLSYSTINRFASGERPGITLATAAVLCEALGLELRVTRRCKK